MVKSLVEIWLEITGTTEYFDKIQNNRSIFGVSIVLYFNLVRPRDICKNWVLTTEKSRKKNTKKPAASLKAQLFITFDKKIYMSVRYYQLKPNSCPFTTISFNHVTVFMLTEVNSKFFAFNRT